MTGQVNLLYLSPCEDEIHFKSGDGTPLRRLDTLLLRLVTTCAQYDDDVSNLACQTRSNCHSWACLGDHVL